MTKIVSFEQASVPAQLADFFGNSNKDLIGNNAGEGFPSISIKGKVFHIVRGGERTLITKPGEDEPAGSLEVVILRANPNNSKVFYSSGYIEGSDAKPTCFSNDGIVPDAQAAEPQALKCSVCPRNQWGSKITQDGRKARECGDSRRLAIATVGTPNDPMLLRVPAASLKALTEYGKVLGARGVPPQAVVTKVGFDYSVAHPQLKFTPVGIVGDSAALHEIRAAGETELVARIVGLAPSSEAPGAHIPVATPEAQAPAVAKAAAPKPATKQAKSDEETANAVLAAATTAAKKATIKVDTSTGDELSKVLADLDFDDAN